MINVILTRSEDINKFSVTKDTLLYTLDKHEMYFDLNFSERMMLKTGHQVRDEDQLFNAENPRDDKIYLSLKSSKIYRYYENKFLEIQTREQISDLLIGMKELKPVVLSEDGVNIAPRTLASQVFTPDGRNLDKIIEDRTKNTQVYIYTKSITLEAEMDNQKVFTIPFPIPGYDMKKSPIEIIFGKSEFITSENYKISRRQLIFSDVFAQRIMKGNLITVIFHYTEDIIRDGMINAHMLNGRQIIYSDDKPLGLKVKDIWYNTKDKVCLELTENGFRDILNPENIDVLQGSTIIDSTEMEIPIPIEGFDKKLDALEVYRNGLAYIPDVDYTISDNSANIIITTPDVFVLPGEMNTYLFKVTKNGIPRKSIIEILAEDD